MGRATINETRQNETVIIRWSTLEKPRTARLIVQSFEKTQNKAEVCPAITRFPFKCETIGLELQSRNHQSNRFLMNSQHLRGHCAEGGKMQNVSAASFARGHTTSVFLSSSGTQIKRPVSSARGRAADCICVQTHLCSCCVIRAEGKHCHCGGFFLSLRGGSRKRGKMWIITASSPQSNQIFVLRNKVWPGTALQQ